MSPCLKKQQRTVVAVVISHTGHTDGCLALHVIHCAGGNDCLRLSRILWEKKQRASVLNIHSYVCHLVFVSIHFS